MTAQAITGDVPARRGTAARRFGRASLTKKLASAFLGLVALVLVVNGAVDTYLTYHLAKGAALEVEAESARGAVERIGAFLSDIETELGWTTGVEWGDAELEQQRFDFVRLLRQAPAITSLSYIDGHGKEQIAISRLEPDSIASGKDFSADPRFVRAVADKIWFGPVEVRRGSEPYMTIALAHFGKTPGVTVADVNLKLVWDVVSAIHVGNNRLAYVVDDHGRRIAHSDLRPAPRDPDFSALPQVAEAMKGQSAGAAVAKSLDGAAVLTAFAIEPNTHWAVFVEQPLSEALAPAYAALARAAGLLVIGLVMAAVSGVALARRMAAPIRELQMSAERLGAGDLAQRLDIRTGDEIEALAGGFNRMAVQLQESYENLEAKVEARTRDLNEALQQQTATADVLKAISRSALDLGAVLTALIDAAVRLCRAGRGSIWLLEGDRLVAKAFHSEVGAEMRQALAARPRDIDADEGPIARAGRTGKVVHLFGREALDEAIPAPLRSLQNFGAILAAPLLRGDEVMGVFALPREEPIAFTRREIELVESFADQAVIAIENARLFQEVQARTRDLEEALARQTATAEILRVISESPTDAKPVFDRVVETAAKLLRCDLAFVMLTDGKEWWGAALAAPDGMSPELTRIRNPVDAAANFPARAILSKAMLHLPDWSEIELPAHEAFVQSHFGIDSSLYLPFISDGECMGVLVLASKTANAFGPADIAQAESFRDQAVIAIQNARLFNETQEALAQQTATADVLKVISRSVFDLDTVLQTLIDTAVRLTRGSRGTIFLKQDDVLVARAFHSNVPAELRAYLASTTWPIDGDSQMATAARERAVVHISDLSKSQIESDKEVRKRASFGAGLWTPLMRGGEVIGVFGVPRDEPVAFTAREIELIQTFADQAVIAIENSRLFEEVQAKTRDLEESLSQQTATADVLKVISRSAFGLKTVLQTLVDSAVRLCASDGVIYLRHGDEFRAEAAFGYDAEGLVPRINRDPRRPGRGSVTGRVALSRQVEQIPDNLADPDFKVPDAQRMKMRALLGVPLLRDGEVEGVFVLGKPEPGLFGDRVVELVRTFADQAVIAIENTRLFEEIQAKTRDLSEALVHQTASGNILKVIASSPTSVAPALQAIVDSACEVCGAYDAAVNLREGDFVRFSAHRGPIPLGIEGRPLSRRWVGGRAILDRAAVHVADLQLAGDEFPEGSEMALRMGHRAILAVPLLREGDSLGAIVVRRTEAHPFTEKQIELLRSFADQAVIAIGNVRLFNEVQARTRDLEESLARQTATAEILRVISESPTDAKPVFDRVVETAAKLLRCDLAFVMLTDGKEWWGAALATPAGLVPELVRDRFPVDAAANFPARAILSKALLHLPDWAEVDLPEHEAIVQSHFGIRSSLNLPFLSEGECIGVLVLASKTANAFGPADIAQAESFRDQAVIAIQNARLFNETKEALERQTATARILEVIASSPTNATPVFSAIADSAKSVMRGFSTTVWQFIGDAAHLVAFTKTEPEAEAALKALSPMTVSGNIEYKLVRNGECVAVEDTEAADADPDMREVARRRGWRSSLNMPLQGRGSVLGFISVTRAAPGSFSEQDFGQLRSFANQAVIAIENARLFEEVKARTRDLEESLQQQTATADVLKVISRSAFDLQLVLDTLVASAAKLCQADRAGILMKRENFYHSVAGYGYSEEFLAYTRARPIDANGGSVTARAGRTRSVVQVEDASADPDFSEAERVKHGNIRTLLGVPLLRDGVTIGVFVMTRVTVRPFDERQIELLGTFADQAVIAVENARLLNEVQARTRDLEESLAQQTATADVLKVISRSAFDLDAILKTLVTSAMTLCRADGGQIFKRGDDGNYRYAASNMNVAPEYIEHERNTVIAPGRGTLIGRVALDKATVRIVDAWTDDEYQEKAEAHIGGVRSMLGVPLLRDGEPIGAFALARQEPTPFTQQQVDLVSTFADQAVIAIENARLFTETQEALERQIATADILKVIASSPDDVQPVFDAITSRSKRLVDALSTAVYTLADGVMHQRAFTPTNPEADAKLTAMFPRRLADFPFADSIRKGEVYVLTDTDADPVLRDLARLRGFRSNLFVPLLRDNVPIGMISVTRARPGPFADHHVELLRTFADQAVIAINNVQLFNETKEALQQQTATADVLKVISRSAFDLDAIFQTLVTTAVELCAASSGTLCVRDGDVFRYRGMAGPESTPALQRYLEDHPLVAPTRGTIAGRAILSQQIERITDVLSEEDYVVPFSAHGSPARSLLGVPLMGKTEVLGAIVVARAEPGDFPQRHVEILRTFADQAVIAIENSRLFEEVQARTRELSQSLDDLRKTQDRLVQSEKLASLGQLTAGIAHEIKNPLNFVNNFAALSRELLEELRETLQGLPDDAKADADNLMGMIDSNLEKVASHGRRADSIVKNMLLHSREGSGERTRVSVNAMVEEALNLGYHGARAEKPGFNVTIEKALDPNAGEANLYLQEITRVLLNLISNGFYASAKRRQSEGPGYEPILKAATRSLGDRVEIRIRDNGTGIPEEVRAKMFNPFFTTKPAGEGTGLGLSLSHDIVVKQHGGTLDVETAPGAFTEFIITLPREGAKA